MTQTSTYDDLQRRITELEAESTERQSAEKALRESKQLLERTFASLQDAIFILNAADSKIQDCNPAAVRMFGYSRAEMLGRETSFLHVDEVALEEFRTRLYLDIQENGFLWVPEFRMKRKDGTVFPTEHSVVSIEDEDGKRVGWVSVVRDITERKCAEEALKANEEKFRVLASNIPDHVLIQDRELRYTLVLNPQLGLIEADMIGKTDRDFLETADAEKLTAIKRTVLETSKPFHMETSLTNREGGTEYFEGAYIPKHDQTGQVDGLIGYFRNVTERKRAEEEREKLKAQLLQAQKSVEEGNRSVAEGATGCG